MSVEGINFSIASTSVAKLPEREQKIRNQQNFNPIYHRDIVAYIKNNIENEEIQKRLLKDLNNTPQGALLNFVKNLQNRFYEHQNAYNEELFGNKVSEDSNQVEQKEEAQVKNISAEDLLSMQDNLYNTNSENTEGLNDSISKVDVEVTTNSEMQNNP